MKLKEFTYRKTDGMEKRYEVAVIKDNSDSLEGISIGGLPLEERETVKNIILEFERKLEPFMKNYRKFLKSNIKADPTN